MTASTAHHDAITTRRSSRYAIPADAARRELDAAYPGTTTITRADAAHLLDEIDADLDAVIRLTNGRPAPTDLAAAEQHAAAIAGHAARSLTVCAHLESRWATAAHQALADTCADLLRDHLAAAEAAVRSALDTPTT